MSKISDYSHKDSILPDSLNVFPNFLNFDLLGKLRIDGIPLTGLLVYDFNNVDASAIPDLANQLDVLGYGGMKLATTEDQQRAVLKNAIELHRYKGTLWAVKQAMANVGYGDAEIIEHADMTVENGWATFRVNVNPGIHPVNVSEISELVKMINEYKNVRSHLLDLSYNLGDIEDDATIEDSSYEAQSELDNDTVGVGGNFTYNGENEYDGSKNYSDDTDVLDIQILDV